MATTGFLARLSLAVALAVAAPIALSPTTPAVAQMMGAQVTLTTDLVEAFIRSYPEVKAGADALGDKYGVEDGGSVADAWGAWMTATAAWGELNGLVTSYGFENFQTWVQTTITIAMTYAFAKEGPAMDAGMAAAVAQIQNDPNIPEAQKKMMLDQMQASLGLMGAMRPSQENIDAVTPYLDQLATLFD